MQQTRALVIRRFALGPLAQWGFVAGALVACFPAFVCSWLLFALTQSLRGLMLSWRDVGFEVLGQRLSFNVIEVLKLDNALDTVSSLAGFGVLGIVLLALFVAIGLGVFGAIVLLLLGVFYNTTGRLRVDVQEVPVVEQPQA